VVAAAFATVYTAYKIGDVIYTDLDDYEVKEPKGNSDRFTKKMGFTATSAPLGSYQTSTLDLEAGLAYWPLYGENFGIGGGATFSAGTGIFYQNGQLSADGTVMGYYGSKNLRGVFESHIGIRRLSVYQWIFDDLNYTKNEFYHRFMAGVSFNTTGEFYGYSQTHVDLLAIYENINNPIEFGGRNNFQPLGENASYGLRLNVRFEDRINFYAETVLRRGDNVFVKIGAIRNWERFGISGSRRKLSKLIATKGKNVIYPLVTSFNWANEKSTLDSTLATSSQVSMNFGAMIEKDINLTENWSAQVGAGVSILHGTRFNSSRYRHSSLNLSAGIRYSEYLSNEVDKYWVLAGINNRINIQKNISNLQGGVFVPIESIETNRFVPQWMLGAGMDYTVGGLSMRTGIQYDRSIGSLYKDDYKTLTSNTISLNWGYIF
jgi:hypothetical protein